MCQENLISIAEQMYKAWDIHWSNNDVEDFLELYVDDVVVESPLIAYLLDTEQGICHGKAALGVLAYRKNGFIAVILSKLGLVSDEFFIIVMSK